MRFALALVLVACVALQAAHGQVVTGPKTPFTSRTNHLFSAAPVYTVGSVDTSALTANNGVPSRDKPYDFGVGVPVELNMDNSGAWTQVDGGKVWRLTVTSHAAKSLNLVFSYFDIPKGGELYFYNADKTSVLGGFTHLNVKDHHEFGTTPIMGDSLTVEYYQPTLLGGRTAALNISSIVHGVRTLGEYHDSGSCNVNVVCSKGDNWRKEIRGAAMIQTKSGTRWCSGSMINNAKSDGRQLFLTANHCCQGQSTNNWVAIFNYESPICDYDKETDGSLKDSASGMTLLSSASGSDFCLLEIQERIPKEYNVFLNGFEAREQVPLTPFVIHHPSCDVKKISNSDFNITSAGWGTDVGDTHWKVPEYTEGTTEPGSSGSPLFDQNHRIVGQLHGGEAACSYNYNDYYGKVSKSWQAGGSASKNQLQPFLDPENKGILTVDGRELY